MLALAQGHCDDTRLLLHRVHAKLCRSAKWAKVSERFWSQLVGACSLEKKTVFIVFRCVSVEEKPKKDTPKAPGPQQNGGKVNWIH